MVYDPSKDDAIKTLAETLNRQNQDIKNDPVLSEQEKKNLINSNLDAYNEFKRNLFSS